jgi:hypothetical protein
MFDLSAITHVAHSVEDLDLAMRHFGESLGLIWASVQEWDMTISVSDEVVSTPIRFTYSRNSPPHIELIEGQPGTIWAPHRGLHHVGVWTDDLAGDALHLSQSGFSQEAAGVARSGRIPSAFTYHSSPHGMRLELVDVASRQAFDRWLAGGELS